MSFADKKGITVASGFKLQAEALLDARGQVETIAERDELVTLHAVTAGLQVYVKADKTLYVYNGTSWDELSKGNMDNNLQDYVQKENGKVLSSNDYTDTEKNKLSKIEEGANKTVVDAALSATSTNPVQNKAINAALSGKLPASSKGAANGVAELDASGKVPSAQLPSYVDDVVEGYVSGGKLYQEAAHTTQIPCEAGKIYVDLATNKTYRWSGSTLTEISASLTLGETSSTAYRGDRGKVAYDHSQTAHAPANAEANVQSDWNATDTDSDSYIKNKPSSLPANGGNADTVNGHTVESNVPANAKFTDTVYTHPSNHEASMITQDATHRFVSNTEKAAWNAKANVYFASELPASAPAGSVCFLI